MDLRLRRTRRLQYSAKIFQRLDFLFTQRVIFENMLEAYNAHQNCPKARNLRGKRIHKQELKCKKNFATLIALFLLLSSAVSLAADDEELAQSILEKSDQIRFPRESFQVDVAINTTIT